MKLAKQNYCYCVLNKHKSNSQKEWQAVNELGFSKYRFWFLPTKLSIADCHAVIDEETIAKEFNDHFVDIRKAMADALATSLACGPNLTATKKPATRFFSRHTVLKKFLML